MQQVRLSQTDASVQEQRVVGAGRILGDRHAGRMRQAVARAHNEALKRVAWIEVYGGDSHRLRRGLPRQHRRRLILRRLALPDDKPHLNRPPRQPSEDALDGGQHSVFQPVARIGILDAHDEGAVLISQELRVANPGVKR